MISFCGLNFFGFNALCGVRLCCALESLGLMRKHGKNNVFICDKSLLLNGFYPHPAMIDLNLPVMAVRAAEMLLQWLGAPGIPGLPVFLSSRLIGCKESSRNIIIIESVKTRNEEGRHHEIKKFTFYTD